MKLTISMGFIAALLIVASCKKESSNEILDIGHNYYPISQGSYCTFTVNAVTYDDFYTPVLVDTARYELKEVIGEYLGMNGALQTYKLYQYKRIVNTDEWDLINVWTIALDNFKIIRNEENESYIKLVFPVNKGARWNGNAYNVNDKETYEYADVHYSFQISGFNFDSVLTVLQRDESSLIDEYYAEEKYAKNIGLIYKKKVSLQKEVDGSIKSGFDITFTLLDYGKQ